MSNERTEKLYTVYTLCRDLFLIYPKAIDVLRVVLQDMKKYYIAKKSINDEYVIGENDESR